ncbi:MAG: hypothetical protein U1C71_04100, partial [archaeon]|nr:hypothetical protein [archaeon]
MKPIDSAAGGLKIPLIHRSARSRACIGRKPIVLAAGRSKTSLVPRGGRTKTAGQSSVELLIVLAISLVLLAALVDFTVNQVSRVEKQHAIRLGQEGVQRLIREIDEVYSLGPGNTRDIIIPWPRGVDSSRSRLEGRSIILQVYDFQIAGTAIPSLRGTIPSQPGLVRFRLVSDADSVLISLSTVTSDVDSVYVAMPRDANASARVVFSNTGTQDADTVLVWTWDHTLVDASIGPSVFTLSPGESQNVDLNFYSESTAIGNYVGYLTMNADISGTPESITIPVNVEVFPNTQGLLTSVPSVLRFSTLGADTNSLTLQLCNVGQTPLTNLSFTPSSGNAGDWITPISIISSLSAQSCQNVNVEVTVPGGTDLGLYTGSVSITDFTGANHLILGVEVQVNG